MKKIELSDEELEMMNYNDVAYVILETNGKKMKIIDLLREVVKVMKLDEDEYQEHITDFFELLSTDKRFIMLEDGYWDLRIKHNKGMVIESDEEDDDDEELILESEESNEDEDYDDAKESDDDVEDDDLSDLVIIDDADEEESVM